MVLTGSNNCYEVRRGGKERRERGFCTMYPYLSSTGATGIIFDTPKNLIERATAGVEETVKKYAGIKESWHTEENPPPTAERVRKAYGWYTSLQIGSSTRDTSAEMYVNLYKDGCRKALTVEQLHEIGIHLKFSTYISTYSDEKPSIPQPENIQINTTEIFFQEYEKWTQWKKECIMTDKDQKQSKPPVYLSYGGDTDGIMDRLKRFRANNKPPAKTKVTTEQDHYFVLENGQGYLIKYTRNGYRYSYENTYPAKEFDTEKTANKYLTGLIAKRKHKADTWKVTRVDKKTTFLKVA